MDSVSVHCLGVGDGTASTGRNHSAYLYSFDGTRILIDSGEPVSRSLKLAGLGADSIDALFISHLHSDHIGGLFMLLQGYWLDQRRKLLPIHMPKDGIEPVRQMLRTAYLFDEILPFRLKFETLRSKQPVEIQQDASDQRSGKPVRVTPFPTTHLDRARKAFQALHPGEYAAYSFLLESAGARIAHSADIGAPEDLDPLLSQPVDLLVCEVAHFEPADLFAYLRERPIKRLLLIHLARYYWEKFDEIRSAAEKELPSMNVSFARDGQVVQL